ncbi:P-loop containing nucleoside triphosphate hydrolase protein [Fusarium tricinctum]|uniref:P-loop containing nucleoside triphosphate hydrolase protein n=1 Tax=Fusarium tricinctum TaxID=61284 RepID=A0A8K0WH50_9HYPO|nr:P-loop containing nucleoside triphosphate hydrolase protein [Fusarium tricinctum]
MDDPSDGIILVMGVTGAGKSYFLNQLKSQSVSEGHSLCSETRECQAIQIFLDEEEKRSITVVDTPGFDDTKRSQADILAEITDYLAAQHISGLPLRGILYLHKISDNRMTKTSRNYLQLLTDIVGDDALKNVILVTTMWNTLRPEGRQRAVQREQELLNNFWSSMIDKGSYVAQFNGTPESAYPLIFQLADQKSVVLEIQKEIVDEDRSIIETATGRTLVQQLEKDHEAYQMDLCNLQDKLERELNSQPLDKGKIKQLKDEISEVEKLLQAMSSSVDHMRIRPGSPMRQRMKQAMKESGKTAAMVLGLVLNVTYFAVQLGLGM